MKRVWIYQSNRFLQDEEIARIEDVLSEFVEQWTAHGNQLAGSFSIRYGLFLMLMVDEEKAMVTGCSIDKSVHLLKKIEQELGISLFDRMQIAFRDPNSGNINIVGRDTFSSLVKDGLVHADTIVFNNMLTLVNELDEKWEVPLKDSWHARVFL
ncbi:ABC transporter ATPase [Sphingobacterium bambusae]|uniref:ABC transporter ATPase n=1 Tax=Sphingobacterium bambusae TaxID=662858 RepID=A0ABW6BGR2_9SPHI|nr:ABC transporter ATPase [Sphingobacterium bambusae]WPL50418.1 ABC transporter ATPase [Sphingobacterium bambusae]